MRAFVKIDLYSNLYVSLSREHLLTWEEKSYLVEAIKLLKF